VWPVPAVASVHPVSVGGAPPVLVLGTTNDPVTPLASARALTRVIDGSVLLVSGGEQHGSFALGNRCVDRVVTRYLVDREPPRRGTRC
jgi:hypothetical protein